jgi:hypothetical protein
MLCDNAIPTGMWDTKIRGRRHSFPLPSVLANTNENGGEEGDVATGVKSAAVAHECAHPSCRAEAFWLLGEHWTGLGWRRSLNLRKSSRKRRLVCVSGHVE